MVIESKIYQAKSILDVPSNEFDSQCGGHTAAMKPENMAMKEMSKFEVPLEELGSLSFASDSLCHDLFDNDLTKTDPFTTSAVIDEDDESCQDDRAIINDNNDWEDLNEEENDKNGGDEKISFQRIQFRVNPTPKRESLITLAIHSTQHHGFTSQLGHVASKCVSTDAQHARHPSSLEVSPGESDEPPPMRMGQKPSGTPRQALDHVPRSSAQPISFTSNGDNEPVIFSPRTTRRNMIATEFTESLCRHLLQERKQKTLTANAVLKHRRTFEDVATLDPEQSHMIQHNSDIKACSWDQGFICEAFAGYHTRGW